MGYQKHQENQEQNDQQHTSEEIGVNKEKVQSYALGASISSKHHRDPRLFVALDLWCPFEQKFVVVKLLVDTVAQCNFIWANLLKSFSGAKIETIGADGCSLENSWAKRDVVTISFKVGDIFS